MKKILGAVLAILIILTIVYGIMRNTKVSVENNADVEEIAMNFEGNLVEKLNGEDIVVTVGGNAMSGFNFDFYVSDRMKLMVETDFLRRLLSCNVTQYDSGIVLIMKGENSIVLEVGSNKAKINDNIKIDMLTKVEKDEKTGKVFIPLDDIGEYINYKVNYHIEAKWIDMVMIDPNAPLLPAAYDMREYGRSSAVRDQSGSGTCWAFASLGAFESTLLPEENLQFSPDHMAMCNSFSADSDIGGEALMSIAYLSAWQGPVYEADDPYGDGVTNPKLVAVKHLEEAIVIKDRDLETIKSAVFRYGGAETSLYSQLGYVDSESIYYSNENNAYYYNGHENANHDVVIVGWDDNFPKEKFSITPEGDGAFICKNSWGSSFGDKGYFYVSYYDTKICEAAVVYSKIGTADNYDKIYQSDLLGWVGQIGFGSPEAYLANVYTAGVAENLAAVSFYATGNDTEFEVYVVRNFENAESLKNREYQVAGSMKYPGYYTVDLPKEIELKDNEKFAVVVKIKTPNEKHPVAVEYHLDANTANFDIKDGEGYISMYGELWQSVEEKEKCNLCLKAFTNRR